MTSAYTCPRSCIRIGYSVHDDRRVHAISDRKMERTAPWLAPPDSVPTTMDRLTTPKEPGLDPVSPIGRLNLERCLRCSSHACHGTMMGFLGP
jgi:hypothetical protein